MYVTIYMQHVVFICLRSDFVTLNIILYGEIRVLYDEVVEYFNKQFRDI